MLCLDYHHLHVSATSTSILGKLQPECGLASWHKRVKNTVKKCRLLNVRYLSNFMQAAVFSQQHLTSIKPTTNNGYIQKWHTPLNQHMLKSQSNLQSFLVFMCSKQRHTRFLTALCSKDSCSTFKTSFRPLNLQK